MYNFMKFHYYSIAGYMGAIIKFATVKATSNSVMLLLCWEPTSSLIRSSPKITLVITIVLLLHSKRLRLLLHFAKSVVDE